MDKRTTFLTELKKSNISRSMEDALMQRYDTLVDNFGSVEGHATAVEQYLPQGFLQSFAATDAKKNARDNWIQSLSKLPQLNDKHREYLLGEFDKMMDAGEDDAESCIAKIIDKYFERKPKSEAKASTVRYVPSTQVSREIESSLHYCPKPKPRKSALENIKDITKRFNSNLHKNRATLCSAFTAGRVVDIMSPLELTALEQRVPQIESENDMAYQAFGHVKENLRNLNGLVFENPL